MGLGSILGRRPTATERPRFDALGRWLLARAAEVAVNGNDVSAEPEADGVHPTSPRAAPMWCGRGSIALRNVGSRSSPSPSSTKTATSTADMLEHIAQRSQEGLAALMVASADGQAFRLPLGGNLA